MLTFYPSRIPDPGAKKAPDPGSGSATMEKCINEKSERHQRKGRKAAIKARKAAMSREKGSNE